MPVMLGEFNDHDLHRDLNKIAREDPYWASENTDLNPVGVRWLFETPRLIRATRFCRPGTTEQNEELMRRSVAKGCFVRRRVFEAVRSESDIAGYAITGWRHTPISTSGMVDDEMRPIYPQAEVDRWNSPNMAFLIPTRRPPWVPEGNRPGYRDSQCFFVGQVLARIGFHSVSGAENVASWRLLRGDLVLADGSVDAHLDPCVPKQVCEVSTDVQEPGELTLEFALEGTKVHWPIWVVERPDWAKMAGWSLDDPLKLLERKGELLDLPEGDNLLSTVLTYELLDSVRKGGRGILLLTAEGTTLAPFFRECIQEFDTSHPVVAEFADKWERLLPIAAEATINMEWLRERTGAEFRTLIYRVDLRTYAEAPYMVEGEIGKGKLLVTTLRPFGGLGVQPTSLKQNPAGSAFLSGLMKLP